MLQKEEEELKSMGLCKILAESFSILGKYPKIIGIIGLMFTVPIFLIKIVSLHITKTFSTDFSKIKPVDGKYSAQDLEKMSKLLSKFMVTCLGLNFIILFFTFLSLVAIVYVMVCIYAGEEIKWPNAIRAAKRGLQRVSVTFLCWYILLILLLFVASFIYGLVVVPTTFLMSQENIQIVLGISVTLYAVVVIAGGIYMLALWDIVSVVSLVEETYGFGAVKKGNQLLKGRRNIAIRLVSIFGGLVSIGGWLYGHFVVGLNTAGDGKVGDIGMVASCALVVLFFVTYVVFSLTHTVAQVVLYTVCKAHHGEPIESPLYGIPNGDGYSKIPTTDKAVA